MSTENTNFRFTAEEETPVHGHTELTEEQVEAVNEQLRDIADVPAIEIISSAAIHMMSAAAVKCGLAADENADDLRDPRRSTQSLSPHWQASSPPPAPEIGSQHAAPCATACAPYSSPSAKHPLPGRTRQGPGEKLTGPVYYKTKLVYQTRMHAKPVGPLSRPWFYVITKPRLPCTEEDGASSHINHCEPMRIRNLRGLDKRTSANR